MKKVILIPVTYHGSSRIWEDKIFFAFDPNEKKWWCTPSPVMEKTMGRKNATPNSESFIVPAESGSTSRYRIKKELKAETFWQIYVGTHHEPTQVKKTPTGWNIYGNIMGWDTDGKAVWQYDENCNLLKMEILEAPIDRVF